MNQYLRLHIAIEVMLDLEKSRSASLNLRFRLSAFEFVALLEVRYRSQPRMMFPHSWVSSRYDPSKAYICRSRLANCSCLEDVI